MKKLLASIFVTMLCVCALAGSKVERGYKVYGPSTPGELYFTMITNLASQSQFRYTNNEIEIWHPLKVDVIYPGTTRDTGTVSIVYVVKDLQYLDTDTTFTNEFGNVITNFYHGLTNTAYQYITNATYTYTNTGVFSDLSFKDFYIGKGDIVQFTFSASDNKWIHLIGKR